MIGVFAEISFCRLETVRSNPFHANADACFDQLEKLQGGATPGSSFSQGAGFIENVICKNESRPSGGFGDCLLLGSGAERIISVQQGV